MIKLPADFSYSKYGVFCRLVNENDAPFIVELRNSKLSKQFLHASDSTFEKQIKWTKEYKERERAGIDYYFIFFKDDIPFGVCRLYNIDWTHLSCTSGSWACMPGVPMDVSLLASVITGEIENDILGLLIDIYEVNKSNYQVLKYHRKILHAIEYGETETDILFISTPESRKNSKLRRLLSID